MEDNKKRLGTAMKLPLLKTNMERLLFAASRQRVFEEAAAMHKQRAVRAQRPDTYRKACRLAALTSKRANFWNKVFKYYSAKIEGADYFITRYL